MSKLKKCPFCGSDAEIKAVYKSGLYHAICSNNDCDVYPCGNMFLTEQEAIEAWNKRASE